MRQEGVDKPHHASYKVLDQRQGPHSVRSVHPGTWNEDTARGNREGRNPHGRCPGPETESVLSKKKRLKKCKPLGCKGSDTPIPAAKDTDLLRAGCPRPRPNTRGCAHFGQKPGLPVCKPDHRATGNTHPPGGLIWTWGSQHLREQHQQFRTESCTIHHPSCPKSEVVKFVMETKYSSPLLPAPPMLEGRADGDRGGAGRAPLRQL